MSAEKIANPWAPSKPLSRARELAAIWMFVKRDLLLQTYFKFSFSTGLMETVSSLVIYGMIVRFGQSVPELVHMGLNIKTVMLPAACPGRST
ncbi:MAG: hypothetical protein M3380_21970 [Chloroflexota bacterium]|nr:hypothetical protein [Chloroflexota bacterium]